MTLLKGQDVAASITEDILNRTENLKKDGIIPKLAILRIGEKPGDISYEKGAVKRCEKTGIAVLNIVLPENAGHDEIISAVNKINEDDSVHGCLILRPFDDKKTEEEVSLILDPKKDVDCMTPGSLYSVFAGKGNGFPPCTARACIEILDYYGYEISGKNAAVLGRSLVIGRPVSMLLQHRNATVTMCHTKTENLPDILKRADIIIAAAGKRAVVDASMVSPGQIVIDVGINVNDEGKLCGDVDTENVENIVSAITPVPGGVGAVTTAVLCKHVTEAAEKCRK